MNKDSLKKILELAGDQEFSDLVSQTQDHLEMAHRIGDSALAGEDGRKREKEIHEEADARTKERAAEDAEGIALVLNGGGGKGAYQVGVYEALCGMDFPEIAAYSGTSIGALNAVMFAGSGAAKARNVWEDFEPERLYDLTGTAASGTTGLSYLESLIRASRVTQNIHQYSPIVSVTAFDTETQYPRDFILNQRTSEEQIDCLMASAAYPLLFSRRQIDGKTYVDGGFPLFGDNMPISPLYHLGFRRFLVVHTESARESSGRRLVQAWNAELNQQKYFNGALVVHLYPGEDMGGTAEGTLNFTPEYIREKIELGRRETLAAAGEIKRLTGSLPDGIAEVHWRDGRRYRNYAELLEDL